MAQKLRARSALVLAGYISSCAYSGILCEVPQ